MFGLGIWELAIIGAILLLLFGAKRLPAVGESLGKATRQWREATGGDQTQKDEADQGDSTADLLSDINRLRQLKSGSGKLKLLKQVTRLKKF
jgi:sec-independent protein translocase protein TatA